MTHTIDRPELQVQQHYIDFHSTEWKLEHRLGVSHERHRPSGECIKRRQTITNDIRGPQKLTKGVVYITTK